MQKLQWLVSAGSCLRASRSFMWKKPQSCYPNHQGVRLSRNFLLRSLGLCLTVFFMGGPSLAWGEVTQKAEEILEFQDQSLASSGGELSYFRISESEPSSFELVHRISDSKHQVAEFRSSSSQENLASILVKSIALRADLSFTSPNPESWRYGKLFLISSSEEKLEPEMLYGEISPILNPSVERKIRYFQTVIPDRFQEWLDRFQKYKPVVEKIFVEFGLPKELIYLSVIESGFNPRAYSRARAAGPWQFMKGTGRTYGLRVNWYVDERRDPVKSSVAAAQHLRDLYDRFGSWPLALSAYNAGAGKIARAIRKSGTRDYWKIRLTRYIRRETREYVPKFMAVAIIAANPTLFGFRVNAHEVHQYDEVRMNNTIHLRTVAKKTGLAFEDLRRLNPELRRSVTPPQKEGYFLKVPVGMGYHVKNVRDELKQWSQPPSQVNWYRVRYGDSLSVIAHRFSMSVEKLKTLNNLSRNLIRVGKRLRVSDGLYSPSEEGNTIWYRVRRGDSLWTIAKRFSVSVRDLKVLNNLRSSVIQVGRMLMVSP